ncbi:TOLL-like receptor [Chamberlinius hualienensis]
MHWLSISSNDIFGFNTNYFCSIKFYRIEALELENNNLNDSSKLGLGDTNKCEDDNSKCENTIVSLDLAGNPLKILKNNSFCYLKQLMTLYLSNCSLNSIEEDAFKLNNNLKYLKLDKNQLTKIPYLEHLILLEYLSISYNLITSIRNEDFFKFKKLNTLELSFNYINHIDDNAFDQLSELYLLDLSNNKLRTISEAFKILNVSDLNLNDNLLEKFDMLVFPPNVKNLAVGYNLITNASVNLSGTQLKAFSLRRNKIKSLDEIEFPETLETFYLDENEIEYLSISSVKKRKKFVTIVLDENKLKIVTIEGFKDEIFLEYNKPLACSCENANLVTYPYLAINIRGKPCSTINNLNILLQTDLEADIFNVTNNPIACHCENSWLFKNPKTNSMDGQMCKNVNKFNPKNQTTLSSNMLCESNYNNSNRCLMKHPIETHFQCHFECPFPCYCYTTDDFSIIHYYCSNRRLKFVPQWVNSDQLDSQSETTVWLNGNNFSKIINKNFTDYDNVTQLYLKNSQITSIGPLTFEKMTKLKILDLSYNQLTTMKDGTFNQQINLQKLILSHNLISYLPDNIFNITMALQSLHLHYNKLTNYSIWNLKNRNVLQELTIYNNSWTCNCSFIIEFQSYLEYHLNIISNDEEIYCANGNGSLATSPVILYNTSHCTDQKESTIDNTWPIVIGIVAPLGLFMIVYGVIRCIKSHASAKHIKQIERAYRLMKNAGTSIETDGKVFDVFISYSNEDSDFVATKIVPKLEDINDPYHVCVHERNFLGGGSIEDTIIEAIKKSTRIIVILTENYMKSDWCMYEFVIAHAVMIEDQCPRVVLIIKDELPPDINPNLQIYLSTNTYIEWTDKRFWQRLYFTLQSNKLPMEQTLQPMNFLMSTRFIMP